MGNAALNKTVITNYKTIEPFTGDRALTADLSPLQRWVGVAAEGAYFTIDLGAAYFLNSFTAKSMTEATGANVQWTRPGYCNYGYQLSYSNNNASWVTLPTFSSNYASPYTGTITVYPTPYRYVKVAVGGTQINPQVASLVNFTLNEVPCLANLTISQGTLTPSFSPSVMAYTAAVDSTVSSINVVPTTPNSSYIWRVNGTTSQSVNLNYGANTITVTCTSPIDGVTYTYNVVVTRQSPPSKYLSNITMSDGTNNVPIAPTFSGETTFAYTASVPYGTTSVTVTPTSEQTTETITVNGTTVTSGTASGAISLNTGSGNVIKVISTASDGTSQEYDITVTRAGSPNLTGLVVTYAGAHGQSTLALNPGFTSAGHAYTATLTSSIGTVNVTATAQDPNSKLSIAGTPITSGVTYPYIIGTGTSIEIDITQADGTVATPYIITLTR